jgi:hypothetical protein
MITRDTLISGVLAATDRLVDQAARGDWSSAKKTVEQRRMFLHALSQSEAQAGDHDFLKMLRAAAAESEAAIAAMSSASSSYGSSKPPESSSTAPAPSGKSTICMKA